jgi:hypothetical protein
MPERVTSSYVTVRCIDMATPAIERVMTQVGYDPEDFEPELPPSPTFWPRDEPKEPQR